ncbi:hypothetical protein JTE90_001264 [Oedothorax gibbosus]|uniref:Nicotinamide riboside kinase 1 n=1 Tax=Oedothorax gibbosus TaxID=931172 RepID=A0AAV6V2C3_9ARAC|nr:hypothetical protein JTE90_001264 [Oedothorax gibbosus]
MNGDWIVVGVSGCTNSGKTTLADALKEHFPGTVVINQDYYFRSEDAKEHIVIPELHHKNWEKLEAVDWDAMLAKLNEILSSPTSHKNALLIVEGHIIFNHPELRKIFHKMYFLTLNRTECARRRSFRVYNPPDIPGYFDMVVWPMYELNLKDVRDNFPNLLFLDGADDRKKIQSIVLNDLCGYLQQIK